MDKHLRNHRRIRSRTMHFRKDMIGQVPEHVQAPIRSLPAICNLDQQATLTNEVTNRKQNIEVHVQVTTKNNSNYSKKHRHNRGKSRSFQIQHKAHHKKPLPKARPSLPNRYTFQVLNNHANLNKSNHLGVKKHFKSNNLKPTGISTSSKKLVLLGKSKQNEKFQSGLIIKILNGKMTLPDLIQSYKLETVLGILKNQRMHRNPGWFQTFLNSQDNNGNTALHIAVLKHQYELVRILVSYYNALVNILNNQQMTIVDLAALDANHDMCLYLLQNNGIVGPSMYENDHKQLMDCDSKIRKILHAFDQPSKKLEIDILSSFDNTTFIPPLHIYEQPIKFESEATHMNSKEQNISDFVSNVSSSRTVNSVNNKGFPSYENDHGMMGNGGNESFFDSQLDFANVSL